MPVPAKFGADVDVQPLPSGVPSKFGADVPLDSATTPAAPSMGMRDTAIHTFDPLSDETKARLTKALGSTGGNLVSSFANVGLGAGQGIESAFYHPLDTIFNSAQQAIDVLNQTTPDSMLSPQGKAEKQAGVQRLKNQWDAIKSNPNFSLGNLLGGILLAHSVGEVAGPVTRSLKDTVAKARESVRTGAQSLVGAGDRAVRAEVSKAGETQKAADESHLEKTQSAIHETEGRELQYRQAVKAAQDTADAANKALDEQHRNAVQDALQQTREKEDLYQSELRKAKAESEEAYQKKLQEVEQQRAKAEQDHRAELRQYFEKKAKVEQQRTEAMEAYKGELAKQGKIKTTQERLSDASSELRARVETAREKAQETGNEKYSGVNAALNPFEADGEAMQSAIFDASEALKGTHAATVSDDFGEEGGEVRGGTPLIRKMADKFGRGDAFTYEDLQGYYSELGRELSKGTLPGDVYHAYDVLHEAIGNEMQRIADSQGKGAQLLDARNYWRRMKQTFGKPVGLADNASAAIKGANPDFLTDDAQANRVRLLGSFDKSIPDLVQRIGGLQKGLKELPDETSPRVLLNKATEKATAKTSPTVPPPPPQIPNPEPTAPREVAQPTRVEPPDRPAPVEAKLPKAPARIEAPERPEQAEMNTRALREHLVDKWATGESSLNKWQVRALLSGGLSALIDLTEAFGGRAPGMGSMMTEAVGSAAYTFGPAAVAKLLDKPGFREWITRPPEGELNTLMRLPNADRIKITDGLSEVIRDARKKGIKVDPKLSVLFGAGALPRGPKTQALQQARDHGRYAHVAVGPNGHRIGSNDGQTWVDTETGEPVNGQ